MTAEACCAVVRCGSTDEVRLFVIGLRCRTCTPSALAGRPEPVPPARLLPDPAAGAERPAFPHPYGMGGPCALCRVRHHRYGPGGRPLCPACRTTPTAAENRRTA